MTRQHHTILITAGGTLEKWDEVRGHTNLARGTMGCYLAEQALAGGAQVVYLHGYFAQLPASHPKLRLVPFMGIADLGEKLQAVLTTEEIHAVIMTAAVSDWVVDKMFDQQGNPITDTGKISSDNPPVVHFKKAPKVISKIKDWRPDTFLVGFKLEHNADPDYLLQRSRQRMETWRADLVVANASRSLYSEATPHYLVPRSGEVVVCPDKKTTAERLLQALKKGEA
ncbi:DNA/pantothenate metabolism flavoprotein [Tumebacillus sp. BK434]|uniref:phosphopantothenoylcysteine decarboxylase domain-containing protein n=1 Tax=Tumebacillus sp. BK434 TaxID=2512169 RepID=UPI001051A8A9|nr:phosphopantothenoylcysteine decarboxylase [Tumebacillus sp. BK434]TCP58293.1 DNA/pantothenate metabolism flavoprotein [Tumebacillus sp. BK434]